MSEHGLTWDAFGQCCIPMPHLCLPVKPTGTQSALAPAAVMDILSPGHASALGREEMFGPRNAPKKVRFPLKSSGISPEGCRGSSDLSGAWGLPFSWGSERVGAVGSCVEEDGEAAPGSHSSLTGAWAKGGNRTPRETSSFCLPVNISRAD